MVANIATNGNEAIDQRSKSTKSDKSLLLREPKLFNEENRQYALHAAMAGRTGMVVAQLQGRYVHLPLELVTKERRHINILSDFWRAVLESTGQGCLKGMQPDLGK